MAPRKIRLNPVVELVKGLAVVGIEPDLSHLTADQPGPDPL